MKDQCKPKTTKRKWLHCTGCVIYWQKGNQWKANQENRSGIASACSNMHILKEGITRARQGGKKLQCWNYKYYPESSRKGGTGRWWVLFIVARRGGIMHANINISAPLPAIQMGSFRWKIKECGRKSGTSFPLKSTWRCNLESDQAREMTWHFD